MSSVMDDDNRPRCGELRLRNETLAPLNNYLLTRGIPLPPGAVWEANGARIVDASGKHCPSEGKVLQRRADGSIEWLLMDVLLDLEGQESTSLFIETCEAPPVEVENSVRLEEASGLVTVSNGLSSVSVSRHGGSLIRQLTLNGRSMVDAGRMVDLEVIDGDGKKYRASLSGEYHVAAVHQNRLRTQIRLEGKHAARDGSTFLDFALRFTVTAGSPDITLEHTFYCREPRDGKIAVRAMRLVMPTSMDGGATKLLRQMHHGRDWVHRDVEIAENVEIVSSSHGDIDDLRHHFYGASFSHPLAGGCTFIRNSASLQEDWAEYPFHMRPGGASGFRAEMQVGGVREVAPVIGWKQAGFTFVTAFEQFAQLHPKSIEIDENTVTYSIWPEWALPMQVVQGVSKSHVIRLTAENQELPMPRVVDTHGRWEHGYVEPVDVSFDPRWPAQCEVLDCHHFLAYQPEKYPLLENLIEPVPAAGNPARLTYDRQPPNGMFHFGDLVTEDGAYCHNNEDDMQVLFPLQHFLRTGHTYAWDYGKEAARHYMEVDYCEWSEDPSQLRGLIPHTGQHFIGSVYSSHQWTEGLLAYYYLSGDERAREVVLGVAGNHLWWAYNKTDLICGDGREAGVPLINLANAYRLTGDEKYIDGARHIIENFFIKWSRPGGDLEYPYPVGTASHPHKLISGYGDWSSFAGLYRLWEVTGDESFRCLGVKLIGKAVKPGSFTLNDSRGMDFFTVWAYGQMTGDNEDMLCRVAHAIPVLLRRGGHPLRRIHFLKILDEKGLIDERQVGHRAGVIE